MPLYNIINGNNSGTCKHLSSQYESVRVVIIHTFGPRTGVESIGIDVD